MICLEVWSLYNTFKKTVSVSGGRDELELCQADGDNRMLLLPDTAGSALLGKTIQDEGSLI